MCVGVMLSLSDGLESLEDTLTESMLSPELPVGGDRTVSLNGELAAVLEVESGPRKSLCGGIQINTHTKTLIKAFCILTAHN